MMHSTLEYNSIVFRSLSANLQIQSLETIQNCLFRFLYFYHTNVVFVIRQPHSQYKAVLDALNMSSLAIRRTGISKIVLIYYILQCFEVLVKIG